MKIKSKPIPVFQGLRVPQLSQDSGGLAWNVPLLGVNPTRLYVGNNAKGDTWTDTTGTDNLTRQAGTPTYNRPGPGADVLGVKSDGTAFFKGSSGVSTGTQDLIIAIAFRYFYHAANDQLLVSTRTTSGWQISFTGGELRPTFYLNDGTDGVTIYGPNLANGQEAIVVACINRGENSTNGAFAFSNSIAGTGVNGISVAESITDSGNLTLFARPAGTDPAITGTTICAAGIWLGANLFSAGATGAAEMQSVASELTQRFAGIYPQKTSTGNELLTVTRATEATVEVETGGITRVFRQGNGLQVVDDEGLLIQGATTNRLNYSYAIASWLSTIGITEALNATGPDQIANSATTITSESGYSYHYWDDAAGTLGNNNWYEVCVIARCLDATKPWIRISMRNGAWSNYTGQWFNFVTGITGGLIGSMTQENAVIEDWGNGWFAARFFFLGAADEILLMNCCISEAVADPAYNWSVGNLFEVYQCQVCNGKYRHSIIRTNSTQVVRNATFVEAPIGNIPAGDFTITGEIKLPAITTPAVAMVPFDISDEGGGTDRLVMGIAPTTGYPYIYTLSGGNTNYSQTLSAAGNMCDGTWHTFLVGYKNGINTFFKVDSASLSNNHGFSRGGTYTQFAIGTGFSAGEELNGKIRNVKVYNQYLEDD